jgi:hypothetical protein
LPPRKTLAHSNTYSTTKIKPGYRTVIRLIPSQVIATDALHDLPEEDRKCRLPNENGNSQLFDFYSQNACEFECALKMSKQYCNCIPWNFPWTDAQWYNNGTQMCDMFGNFCFHKSMKKMSNYRAKGCDCPQNCQEIAYSIFESRELLDPKELCKLNLINSYLLEMDWAHPFIMEFDNVMYNETSMGEEFFIERCSKVLQEDIALVRLPPNQ